MLVVVSKGFTGATRVLLTIDGANLCHLGSRQSQVCQLCRVLKDLGHELGAKVQLAEAGLCNVVHDGRTRRERHCTAEHAQEIATARGGGHVLARDTGLDGDQTSLECLPGTDADEHLEAVNVSHGCVGLHRGHEAKSNGPDEKPSHEVPLVVARLADQHARASRGQLVGGAHRISLPEGKEDLDKSQRQHVDTRPNGTVATDDLEVLWQVIQRCVECGAVAECRGHGRGDSHVLENVHGHQRKRDDLGLDDDENDQKGDTDDERGENRRRGPRVCCSTPREGEEHEDRPGQRQDGTVKVEFLELFDPRALDLLEGQEEGNHHDRESCEWQIDVCGS